MMENNLYHEGTWNVLDSYYETMLNQRLKNEGLEYEGARDNENYLPYYYDALRDVRSSHPDFTFENEEIDLDTKDLWIKEKQEELSKMNLKKEIKDLQNDNSKLQSNNDKLKEKLDTVQEYFKQNRGAFQDFNQYLSNKDNSLNKTQNQDLANENEDKKKKSIKL